MRLAEARDSLRKITGLAPIRFETVFGKETMSGMAERVTFHIEGFLATDNKAESRSWAEAIRITVDPYLKAIEGMEFGASTHPDEARNLSGVLGSLRHHSWRVLDGKQLHVLDFAHKKLTEIIAACR